MEKKGREGQRGRLEQCLCAILLLFFSRKKNGGRINEKALETKGMRSHGNNIAVGVWSSDP